jgi:hypothetical protein
MSSESTAWYIDDAGGDIVGPLSTDAVVDGIRSGRILLTALARPSSESEWLPLVALAEFQSAVMGESSRKPWG